MKLDGNTRRFFVCILDTYLGTLSEVVIFGWVWVVINMWMDGWMDGWLIIRLVA